MLGLVNVASAQAKASITVDDVKVEAVKTPDIEGQIDKKINNSAKKWAAVLVYYTIKFQDKKVSKYAIDNGKWANLELNWQFMYKRKGAPENVQYYSRFSRSVKYKDIGVGHTENGKHVAVLLVDPMTLKRYFDEGKDLKRLLKMKLSFKVNGLTDKKATTYITDGKKDKTGKYNSFFEKETIKALQGVLKVRKETPFGDAQSDTFNTIVEEK